MAFCIVSAIMLAFASVVHAATSSVLIVSAATVAQLVVVITWICFLLGLFVTEPVWAIASIPIPVLVYRYVMKTWDDTKFVFVLHLTALVTAVAVFFGAPYIQGTFSSDIAFLNEKIPTLKFVIPDSVISNPALW